MGYEIVGFPTCVSRRLRCPGGCYKDLARICNSYNNGGWCKYNESLDCYPQCGRLLAAGICPEGWK